MGHIQYDGRICHIFISFYAFSAGLQASFRSFGPMKIEWPGKVGKVPRYPTKGIYS